MAGINKPPEGESQTTQRVIRSELGGAMEARVARLPTPLGDDIARFLVRLDEQRYARSTKLSLGRLVVRIAEWLCGNPALVRGGLIESFMNDGVVRDCVFWTARLKANGEPRSVNSFTWVRLLLFQFWLCAGLERRAAEEKLEQLDRSLRRNGSRKGPPDLLNFRDPNPEPPPTEEELAQLDAYFEEQINQTRAEGPHGLRRLRRLLTERAIERTLQETGERHASLASMRADKLRVDANGVWRVDDILIKATPKRRRTPPTPRRRVGDEEYSQWYLPAALILLYDEIYQAHGLDLLGYLRDGRRDGVRWLSLADDVTFGRATPIGSTFAPLWLNWDGTDYLRKHRFATIGKRLMRDVIHKPRGQLHLMRRAAAVAHRPLSVTSPGIVEKLLQMGPAQQTLYSLPTDESLGRHLGTLDPFSQRGSPTRDQPTGVVPATPEQSTEPLLPDAGNPPPRATSGRRSSSQQRPKSLTWRDVIR